MSIRSKRRLLKMMENFNRPQYFHSQMTRILQELSDASRQSHKKAIEEKTGYDEDGYKIGGLQISTR